MSEYWNFNEYTYPYLTDESVKRLVEKRNRALKIFLETGDIGPARAYCTKYKVPVPKNEDDFKRYLHNMAKTCR